MKPLVGSDRGSSKSFDSDFSPNNRVEDDLNEDLMLPHSEDILILPYTVRTLGLMPTVLGRIRVFNVRPNKVLIREYILLHVYAISKLWLDLLFEHVII